MAHFDLRCVVCDESHVADMFTLECRKCGSIVEVRYQNWSPESPGVQPPGWNGPPIPLPISRPESYVSLGEGNTPIVTLDTIADSLGLSSLRAKLEFMNPTGSFKDRGTAVMMSVARETGIKELVEDSSGNAGASVSAYAARAGIEAHVFAPSTAPEAKIQQIRVYGANTHSIEGSRERTTDAAVTFYRERGLVYASHNHSPYFIEGTKTFAYELYRQLSGNMPNHIVIPVGNGSLYIGAWKGFQELLTAGHSFDIPRIHPIQASAVMPIAAAFNGESWTPTPGVSTIAGGISVGNPPHLQEVLNILKASNGVALAVEDDEIRAWQIRLAREEGIYAEPTSAAAFAGVERLVQLGHIAPDEDVLVPVTGFGLKDASPV